MPKSTIKSLSDLGSVKTSLEEQEAKKQGQLDEAWRKHRFEQKMTQHHAPLGNGR